MGNGVRVDSNTSSGPDGDLGGVDAFDSGQDPVVAERQMALFRATKGRFAPTGPEGAPEDLNAMGAPAPQPITPPMPQIPRSPPPKTPILEGNAKTNPPARGPKTALALHVARAMGYAVPGTPDSPDELAFAKAAHSALLKMTKGMTVAKFLASHQSPKTRDTFGRLLDAELAKGKSQSNSPVVDTDASAPLSMMARPPLQPI